MHHAPLPIAAVLLAGPLALADPTGGTTRQLDELVVTGKASSLVGEAGSASQGKADARELLDRPAARRGELLETVPGVVITQHSGDGKANQYFVRGYNLDHGTDFLVRLDQQPVNFVTHAHGQGYADLSPVIPELIEGLDYWKGPFFAELGDLSTAGAARFRYYDRLPSGIAAIGMGEHGHFRGLLADSIDLRPATLTAWSQPGDQATASLTYALEASHYDGPWQREGNSRRLNGLLKYHQQDGTDRMSLTAMAYSGRWDSTDQIPARAIANGTLDRFGGLDDTAGGRSGRYSLMGEWQRELARGKVEASAWFGGYDLNLFSNFTYLLNDPLNGDQFQQVEDRRFYGADLNWTLPADATTWTFGVQARGDLIDDIALRNTRAREVLSTVRSDDVDQHSTGLYATAEHRLNEWLRVRPGVRADAFHFDVTSDTPANSGDESAAILSPKFGVMLGPWSGTEVYANAGLGFHSNDARGATITTDPVSGLPADRVDPLVRTRGLELGLRCEAFEDVVSTLAVFHLHSDSELLYVGDAGTSESGPATERYGIEWATYWRPETWLTLDQEITLSEGRLLDSGSSDKIPGSVPLVLDTGIRIGREEGWFGTLRSRFFSPRPLIEDGSVDSRASWQVNARLGWRGNSWEVAMDCLNLLDRKDNDIEYFYTSRLAGEPLGGVDDVHLHPAEPRTVRLSLIRYF